jgi:hypothetical protein
MSITAMKQALEALENCTTWNLTREQFDKNLTAINSLRQAIEQAQDAVLAEREACRGIAADYAQKHNSMTAVNIADAIRARSNT